MSDQQTTQYTKGADGKSLTVTRNFNAPPKTVWRAWTEAKLLDQWWGPKVTVTLLYENEAHMAKMMAMGFQEGFAAGHRNLDELLQTMAA